MKMIFPAVPVLLAALLFGGCGPAPASAQPTAQPTAAPVQTPLPSPDAESAPAGALSFSRSAAGAQTDDGFYAVRLYDDWTGCLFFYDYAARQAVPLCPQINCEHHSDACPAWFGDGGNIPRIVTNGQVLAYCYLSAPARIEIADPDGGNRRVLYEFAANETPDEGFCMDETHLYTLITRVEDSQTTSQHLLRIRLADGSCETVWSTTLSNGTYYFLVGCPDRQLLLKEIRQNTAGADSPEALADQTHTLLLADPRDGSTAPLYRWHQGEALEAFVGGVSYLVTRDHRLCALSENGTLTELARDDRFVPGLSLVQYADGDALWFTAPENGADGPSLLYRLDTDGKEICPVPLSRDRSLTLLGRYGDSLFVRIAPDTGIGSARSPQYALVPQEQLTVSDSEAGWEVFSFTP